MDVDLTPLCLGEPKALDAGVYTGLSRAEYDAIPAFSRSMLKRWMDAPSPAAFKHWLDVGRHEQKPSESLILGQALDTLMLEEDQWDNRFCVLPDDRPARPTSRTRNAKKPSLESQRAIAWWEQWDAAAAGKTELTPQQYDRVRGMAGALRQDPEIGKIFRHAGKAVLVAEINGFLCKGELDLWTDKFTHAWDLKSAQSCGQSAFASAALHFGYDLQWSFYLALAHALGFDKDTFSFVVVESEDPHWTAIHSITPALNEDHAAITEACMIKLKRAMHELAECLYQDTWMGTEPYRIIEFPYWAVKQAQRTIDEVPA